MNKEKIKKNHCAPPQEGKLSVKGIWWLQITMTSPARKLASCESEGVTEMGRGEHHQQQNY